MKGTHKILLFSRASRSIGGASLFRTVASASPCSHRHLFTATPSAASSARPCLVAANGRRCNALLDRRLERQPLPPPSASLSTMTPSSPPQSSSSPSSPSSTPASSPQTGTATAASKKTSVSSDEVSKFSSLASTWWDSTRNPLIGMNPVRVSYIVETLRSNGVVAITPPQSTRDGANDGETCTPRPLSGLRALDVGCGGGLLSESLARLGAEVTAIDPSEEVTNAAREHSRHDAMTATIRYRGGTSVEDLAAEVANAAGGGGNGGDIDAGGPSALFDVVCILEVVEHATDPRSLLGSAAGLLKPDGLLFVSTLNRTVKSYGLAVLGGEYVMGMLPVGTHSWDKFLAPEEVENMVSGIGLEAVDVCGMVVRPPFFDMRWKLDRMDTEVNWIGAYRYKR